MPAAGNHENEVGNGSQGYLPYQTRFALPDNGEEAPFAGNWYAFTVGPIRVVSLNNDDVCLQDGAFSAYRRDHIPGYAVNGLNPYIRGYSGGAQKRWLERTLRQAREDAGIDWIVVCMHQVAMSSAHFNGADIGIRQEWLPLFDRYGVDLVVCGHEHHYERTKSVRGVDPAGAATLRPMVVSDQLDVVDTSKGLVQMIIGGGGTSAPSNGLFYDPPKCDVIMSVGPQLPAPPGGSRPKRVPNKVTEDASWVGVRDRAHPYGFAAFDVDPGEDGGMTSIQVTYYDTAPATNGQPAVFERFKLVRPRRGSEREGERETATQAVQPQSTAR